MTHTHTTKTSRNILGGTISECTCGARKWSNDKAIVGGEIDAQGWYTETPEIKAEAARRHNIEMLETEGYGYGTDKNAPHDSHHPDFQD